jgi:uncharacterized membrane protein
MYMLALLSAVFYGAADFIGGVTSRRASTLAVVVVSQLAGLVLLAAATPFIQPVATPSRADLLWGALAGMGGGVGVGLLYRALAIGTMAVVAPITASCAVLLPVMADVGAGARLPVQTTAGIVLAIVAIVLVSQAGASDGDGPRRASRGVGLAICSGIAIGVFFLALARTSSASGLWPLVAARTVSVAGAVLLIVVTRVPFRVGGALALGIAGGGVLDMVANLLYLIASRGGELSPVVTLASLYPASTVVLARVVLGERLTGAQYAGIACALVAIVLIVGR